MILEMNKEQAKILWILLNYRQHNILRGIKELADDHASVRYAETEEDLKHVTAHWIHETRLEYNEISNLKEKCQKIMFEEKEE